MSSFTYTKKHGQWLNSTWKKGKECTLKANFMVSRVLAGLHTTDKAITYCLTSMWFSCWRNKRRDEKKQFEINVVYLLHTRNVTRKQSKPSVLYSKYELKWNVKQFMKKWAYPNLEWRLSGGFTSSKRLNMSRSMSETGTSRNCAKLSKSSFCPSSFLARFPYSCRTFSMFLGLSLAQRGNRLQGN